MTTVTFEGKEYTLTQDPYIDDRHYGDWRDKEHRYTAHAIDSEGNEYKVFWNVTNMEVFLSDSDDLSEVCAWDSPDYTEKL